VADFDPFLTRQNRPPVPDDRLDDAVRSSLLTLSEHTRQAETPSAAAQIRAFGSQRRRWRILGSAALVVAAVVIAVIIALIGTSSPATKPAAGDPLSPGSAKLVPSTVEVVPPDPANDIGYLTAAQLIDGQLVVTFDRVSWLTGAQAAKQNRGVEPPKGHLIVNNNRRLRTFVVDDAARLLGGVQLGGRAGSAPTRITRQQLVARTAALVGTHGQGPLVSLAHRFGVDGPVSGLKEISNP
jgi:hypothetical protein